MTTIQKWGNSYAVRLPKVFIDKFDLRAGTFVTFREALKSKTLSITPVQHRKLSFDEMISKITKKNQYLETDWGGSIGKEVW